MLKIGQTVTPNLSIQRGQMTINHTPTHIHPLISRCPLNGKIRGQEKFTLGCTFRCYRYWKKLPSAEIVEFVFFRTTSGKPMVETKWTEPRDSCLHYGSCPSFRARIPHEGGHIMALIPKDHRILCKRNKGLQPTNLCSTRRL